MLNLSLNELKVIARSRHVKGYKSMSKERLLSALNEWESVESEKNFDDTRKKKIKKDFNELRDRFFRPKIKEKKSLWNRKWSFYIKNKRDCKKSLWIRKEFY